MKNAGPGVSEGAARFEQVGASIVPHPAQHSKHARRRAWLRLVRACRDADTTARVEAARARIAAHAALEVQE